MTREESRKARQERVDYAKGLIRANEDFTNDGVKAAVRKKFGASIHNEALAEIRKSLGSSGRWRSKPKATYLTDAQVNKLTNGAGADVSKGLKQQIDRLRSQLAKENVLSLVIKDGVVTAVVRRDQEVVL